jgi:trigger factor
VVKALIVQAEIKYPPVALEEELDEVMGLFARRVQSNLRMSLEDYVKAAGKTEDELRSELLPQAEERLERGLVLAKLVEAERLTVDDEEVEQRAGRLSQTLGIKAEDAQKQLLSGEGRRAVVNDLLTEKVLRRLTAIARGEAEETDLESEEDLEG